MNQNQNKTLIFQLGLLGLLCVTSVTAFGQTRPRSTVGKPATEQPIASVANPVVSTGVTSRGPSPSATPGDLSARPPKPTDAIASMKNAKLIFVRSHSLLVGQSVIESKLRDRKEFQQLGLMITRDEAAADLILELKHDVFTKYVFTAIDPSTNVVVASGKLSSLGGTVAGKVAKRFMKQMMKARGY
jgi:hypothetical protein